MIDAHFSSGGRIPKTFEPLAPLASDGADARQIADASVAIWRAIDGALSPVVGRRGSAALYQRSLHLARTDYPWLAAAYESAAEPGDFAALHCALAQQTAGQAAAAHDSMLQTFVDLLADLIGQSLAQRLLQPAWVLSSGGPAAQDTST